MEADLVVDVQGFTPGAQDRGIVDGDADDLVGALALDLVRILDIGRQMLL